MELDSTIAGVDRTDDAGCEAMIGSAVALALALTYSEAKIKKPKEKRCIMTKNKK